MPTQPPKQMKNATFRVPKNILQRAKKRAIDEDRSLNEVVVGALAAYGGQLGTPGARMLADADRFVKQRGNNTPARRFTPDELHEHDDA
ncbi:MAG: hypothetical protein JST92_27465 [Deltaproteobacteria bacterium]|nr:hypothetical protein [Deltaproteobacteria bacterium]